MSDRPPEAVDIPVETVVAACRLLASRRVEFLFFGGWPVDPEDMAEILADPDAFEAKLQAAQRGRDAS